MLYEISERIYKLEKEGKSLIKLNIGEPDWSPPASIMQTVFQAIKNGKDSYGSAAGELELRKKIAEMHECDAKNVVITPGSKWGLYALLKTQMKNNDNAIIFSPHWTAYELICQEIGFTAKIINLKMERNFEINLDELQKTVDSNTKFIILNSPCNPTSIGLSEQKEKQILDFAAEKEINIIADDAYRDLCFDSRKERKFADNLIIANTFSKTFGMTGWRIGYIVAKEEIIKKIIALNQITITCVPLFLQLAAIKALEQKKKIAGDARKLCKKRAELAVKIIQDKMQFTKPNAGFYIFPKLPENLETNKFVLNLLEAGIAVVPGAAFGDYPKHIRISLSADNKKLTQALEKISDSIKLHI